LAAANPGRSRKRGRRTKTPAAKPSMAAAARRRSEERNAVVRATLTPLAPEERPWPIRVGALLALLIAVSNVVQVIVGGKVEFQRQHVAAVGPIIFSVLMVVCAAGMWQKRYWAVLGFQALLAIVILTFALVLVRASSLLGVVVSLAVVGIGGFLFYKLVRVLSRLQMPKYPGR
jgi:hypothetical protein